MVNDTVTHEFTHAVVDYGANLLKGNWPGALNESLADIFAALHDGDWTQGEDKPNGTTRSLSNPPDFCSGCADPAKGDPDQWSERFTGSSDNGGVHTNAGITNKAAFLLVEGGTHPGTNVEVTGLGEGAARFLLYKTMLHMPWFSDPFIMRAMMLAFGDMYYGVDFVRCEIKNAFGAVEVGGPDQNCDGKDENVEDLDSDFVVDSQDNCQKLANPAQEDLDDDGIGDPCDPDKDGDLVPEKPSASNITGDNCPDVYNPDQTDANFNQIGAACDPEEDGDIDDDGVPDENDNCPLDHNPKLVRFGGSAGEQPDSDGDGEGDACDPDLDADGISNDFPDNCINVPNADQADADGDDLGDACDVCASDADDVSSYGYFKDPLTGDTNVWANVPDGDGDGVPDACDPGGFGRASLSIDGNAFKPGIGPRPDGASHTVRVSGAPGDFVAIPIPICLGDCPEAPATDQCIALSFGGLGPDIHAWITDDTADSVGRVSRRIPAATVGFPRVARFQPRGGRTFYLNFLLSPQSAGDEEFTLLQQPCAVGDRSGVPPDPLLPPPLTGGRAGKQAAR
jgi:hypothetical protein